MNNAAIRRARASPRAAGRPCDQNVGYVPSYFLDRLIQLSRSTPGYEDVRPFTDKRLRARKSNPAVAAGDERVFSCKLAHGVSPSFSGSSRHSINALNNARYFRIPPG
jgi:hypothetical protein